MRLRAPPAFGVPAAAPVPMILLVTPDEDDDEIGRGIRAVTRWIALFAVAGTATAFARLGQDVGLAALGGGVLALVVWGAAATIGRRGARARDRGRIGWAVVFTIESAIVMAGAAALLYFTDPTGVAIGFGSLIAGAIAGAIETGARQRARPRPR